MSPTNQTLEKAIEKGIEKALQRRCDSETAELSIAAMVAIEIRNWTAQHFTTAYLEAEKTGDALSVLKRLAKRLGI